MRRQIRRGVFETNSSSMHSITILKKDDIYTQKEIEDSVRIRTDHTSDQKRLVWELDGEELEFGRHPFKVLGSFGEKWRYACAALVGKYNDDICKELVALAKKYIPQIDGVVFPKVWRRIPNKDFAREKKCSNSYLESYGKTEEELIYYLNKLADEWQLDEIEYRTSDGYWEFCEPYVGYADGEYVLGDFLMKENVSLEDFLTHKKYIVIQDGDEYDEWGKMKDIGIINVDAIDCEFCGGGCL